MKNLLLTLVTLGSAVLLCPDAEAGTKSFIRSQHRAVHQTLKQKRGIRRDIQRVANQQSRIQRKSVSQELKHDAYHDRQFHRSYHDQLRRAPRYRSGIGVSPYGIGYSTSGFSIFIGR